LADRINASRSKSHIKKIKVMGLPRQIVLKPSHALYRLQGQLFSLGDRVEMVQDSAVGGVSLSMKGVVIGVNADSIDVVWDVPFMGGSSLGGRLALNHSSVIFFRRTPANDALVSQVL
jgi:5'-3' exoribonuclease 1